MVEWPSSEIERTFNQSAANGRNEPRVTDAAKYAHDSFSKHSGCSFLNCNANLQSCGGLGRPITSPEFPQAGQLM